MNNQFTYSVLKYNHSQLLGESLNLGVLFFIGEGSDIRFIAGNSQRIKSVYPSFDSGIFQTLVKAINRKLANGPMPNALFPKSFPIEDFQSYLLPEDSTSFQFTELLTAINPFDSTERIVEEFSKVLLPEVETKKEPNKHNETFILKKYVDFMSDKNINVEYRMRKNQVIQIRGVKMNFELSWKNGISHLIKPISFDLKQESDIQNKSTQFFGSLNLLAEHAKRNEMVFDLLISKPQEDKLQGSYDDALYILEQTTAPKELITEERLMDYTEKTAEILHSKES